MLSQLYSPDFTITIESDNEMADMTPIGGTGVTPLAQLMQMAMGFLMPVMLRVAVDLRLAGHLGDHYKRLLRVGRFAT